MNINPGKMDKKITIFQRKEKRVNGFPTGEKTTVRTCYASFRRISGTEKMQAGIDVAEERARFLCRYSSIQITPQMQVEYAGDIYDIVFVNDYEDKHEYIEIQAKKG